MDPFDWDEFEDEDEFSDLFMRDIEKKRIMPPLSPFQQGVATPC